MYGLGAIMVVYSYSAAPETRLKFWANDEARERRDRDSVGEESEIGVNYAQEKHGYNFSRTEFGVKPEAGMGDGDDEDDE